VLTHASLAFSVRRFSSSKPKDLAKAVAAGPTSITWSVRSITMRATDEGVLMFSMDATEPAL
jgi:hypothetical protein